MLTTTVQKRMDMLPNIARAGRPVNGLTRLMASPSLWLNAVERIRKNNGSLTPGVDGQTLDGLTAEQVYRWMQQVRDGSKTASPVKRVYIPKRNGKRRPLGIPTYADRMLQEVQRTVLERIYEPLFSRDSHGFRPGRSCHTALDAVQKVWTGTKWFVEVDIKGYFDNIDHNTLLNLLRRRINDERFIMLIRQQLKSGIMEDRKLRPTFSGTPQGGIVSPILANIYLHELDVFMQGQAASYSQGKKRRINPPYKRLDNTAQKLRLKLKAMEAEGRGKAERGPILAELDKVNKAKRSLPSVDPMDPKYRRLNYVRYADDFLIGVIGTRADAEAILLRVQTFLRDVLKLETSQEKTRIVAASDGVAFLGYTVKTTTGNNQRTFRKKESVATRRRTSSERIALEVPFEKMQEFCNKHAYGDFAASKGRIRPQVMNSSDYEIVMVYNAELRGFATYYRLDTYIRSRINRLQWVWMQSLMRTLAFKHKTTLRKYAKSVRRKPGHYLVSHRSGDKVLEIAVWRTANLQRVGSPVHSAFVDTQPRESAFVFQRTDITARLLAEACENPRCQSDPGTSIEVHHVRKLADMERAPFFSYLRSARTRKTVALCTYCHDRLHAGTLH